MIQYKSDFTGFEKRQQILETITRFGYEINNEYIESNIKKFESWNNFFIYYNEYQEDLLDTPEYFIDLVLRTENFPDELIFDSRFPILLIQTTSYLLENEFNNHDITHYIWSICILTHTDQRFYNFFIETNAIDVLTIAATSNNIICSGHAIVALTRLAADPNIAERIISFCDLILQSYSKNDLYTLTKKLIMQFFTNITITTENYEILNSTTLIMLRAMDSSDQIEKCEAICCFSSLVQHFYEQMVQYINVENIFQYLKLNNDKVADSSLEIIFLVSNSQFQSELPIKDLICALNYIFASKNQSRIVLGIKILQNILPKLSNLKQIFQVNKILKSIIQIASGSNFVVQDCACELIADFIMKQEEDLIEYLLQEKVIDIFVAVFDSTNHFLSMKILQSLGIILARIEGVKEYVGSNLDFINEIEKIAQFEEHSCSQIAQFILSLFE